MEHHVIISPSIMCSAPWDIRDFIEQFEKKNIDLIHYDVMDGHFVPNVMMGTAEFAAIKKITKIPLDLHVMGEEADRLIAMFPVTEGDWVSFHPETCRCPYRTLQQIRDKGCKAGIALSPGTPITYIEELKSVLDFVLVMAVEPGFAGQTMVPDHLDKLKEITALKQKCGREDLEVIIDGNTTVSNARRMLAAGATGLVTGTSSMLKGGPAEFSENYESYMSALKESSADSDMLIL